LAAAAAAYELGISKKEILRSLAGFKGVVGRIEVIQDKPYQVIVDFAHTPNALLTVLTNLKNLRKNRLIVLFGCAGERDKNRRKMGQVAAENADITVITAEDPRREGVKIISDEIATWAERGGAREMEASQLSSGNNLSYPVYVKIPDRQQAIDFCVKIAKKNDIIGIFGKGHEQSMCFGVEEKLWSDQEAVKKALKKFGNTSIKV
jgi:UDP-N-acetylmuramoyl-L-alanyl-D-glutamate--2,6-diaminopimelate ligase